MKQTVNNKKYSFKLTFYSIIILSKPPKVIYKNVKTTIGKPIDYKEN